MPKCLKNKIQIFKRKIYEKAKRTEHRHDIVGIDYLPANL